MEIFQLILTSFKALNNLGDLQSEPGGQHLPNFMKGLGATTVIIESKYQLDKDHLIDHSKFNSRFFDSPERETIRLLFFKGSGFF